MEMMNGEVKKGLGILGAHATLTAIVSTLGNQIFKIAKTAKLSPKSIITQAQRTAMNVRGAGMLAAVTTTIGLAIYSAINAYKHSADDKTSGRNTLKSIASYIVPGSGQLMNGEIKKGLGLLAGAASLMALNIANGLKANISATKAGALAVTALSLYSAVDAYRHNKSEK